MTSRTFVFPGGITRTYTTLSDEELEDLRKKKKDEAEKKELLRIISGSADENGVIPTRKQKKEAKYKYNKYRVFHSDEPIILDPEAKVFFTEDCTICFEELLNDTPLIVLDCGHIFHLECLKQNKHNYCPICGEQYPLYKKFYYFSSKLLKHKSRRFSTKKENVRKLNKI